MPEPFTPEEMQRLAAKAVHKIDLLGPRGTTLCTMDEIEAMAALLVAHGALCPPPQAAAEEISTPLSTGDENV